MPVPKPIACLLMAAVFQHAQVQAADTPEGADASSEAPLDEVVVVAHKVGRPVRDIAANVTVVSRDELSANMAATVADVFRYSPGIDYEASGTRFGTEGINIRGIGGNRVAMLVDGVPLSDQFDVGSFSNATRDFINAGLVQRIEVLHGPASALYGSSAVGGVVAVRTPDPVDLLAQDRFGGDATLNWRGADQSTHGTGLLAFGDESLGLLLGGSLRNGGETKSAAVDASLDLRDYERRSGIIKLVANDAAGRTWRAGIIHQDAQVSSDLNSMLGAGRYRSTTALEGDDEYTMDLFVGELEFGEPGDWVDAGVLRAYVQAADVSQHTLDERGLSSRPVSIDRFFSFEQDIRGIELNLQKHFEFDHGSHQLGFGVEARERETEEYRDGLSTSLTDGSSTNVILGEVFPLRDFPVSESTEYGAYLEDVFSFGDWSVIGAVRLDRYELSPSNDPMYAEDYPFAEIVSISESDLSPKLGLIHRLTPDIDVFLQYAHGFRAPPYEDANIGLEIPFFNYRAIPNPDLRSEESDGFELGMRWRGADRGAHVSLFHTRYEDFIESKVRLGVDPDSGRTLFQSQNLSETVIRGAEAGAYVGWDTVAGNWQLDGALYYARGENRDNDEPLNSVGPAQAIVGAQWQSLDRRRQLRLQATMTAAWDERDESRGELFKPAGHAVFDLYFTQELGTQTTLRAGLMNLTDRVYWNWSDVRGLGPDDPVVPYLAQPGRTVTVGVSVAWQ